MSAGVSFKRKISLVTSYERSVKKPCLNLNEDKPADNSKSFRSIPIIPTFDELKSQEKPILIQNIINGNYKNVDHYLEVHFRLLREDFVASLRRGVIDFQTQKKIYSNRSVYQYDNVRIGEIEMSENGVLHQLRFDFNQLKETLEGTTRLAFGSLLCLSCDNFTTAIVATVDQRDNEFVKVRFDNEIVANTQEKYTVLESQAFFEPYRHVLKGLQSFTNDNLPLQQYLVHVKPELEPPFYLKKNATYYLKLNQLNENGEKIEFGVKVSDISTWPTPEDLNMDESQRQAMHLALSSSLAIIQGPPGTGKTHVGLKIIQALLSNSRCNPILVVCYTNHALDQFLEGIVSFTERIVRVGTRSNSSILNFCKLTTILKGKSHNSNRFNAVKRRLNDAVKDVQVEIFKLKRARTRIIHETLLEKCLSDNDEHLLKTIRLEKNLAPPPSSFLAAWLGLISTDLVSKEDLITFVGCETCSGSEMCVFKEEKVEEKKKNEDFCSNFYDAKIGYNLKKKNKTSFYSTRDWAVIIDVGKVCENVPTSDFGYLVSSLGQIAIAIIEQEFLKDDVMTDGEVNLETDAWNLNLSDRWRLYRRWAQKFNVMQEERVEDKMKQHKEVAAQLKREKNREQIEVLCNCEIIGMTTTCAARYFEILKEVGPKIVIVEEAAEVLESHITTCLSKSTQHLILIGDHKQLRPGVNVFDLANHYKFDVSLFERMIRNNIPYVTLQLQHRMRPEISSLLVPHIYPSLCDHPSVLTYPDVRGVALNLYFFDHSKTEVELFDGSNSHANQFEAEFLANLCEYLFKQGYLSTQITILTPYSSQLNLLRGFCKSEIFAGVKITVVDNFQGEESDIVLLSFARSNETNQIGFLKIQNRINVALSRARIGLYCVGNFSHFAKRSSIWRSIYTDLKNRKLIGPTLPLICQTHNFCTSVKSGQDIRSKCPDGGCIKICNQQFECGHICRRRCHSDAHGRCEEACNKILCSNGHRCQLKCYEKCAKCAILIRQKHVTCDHTFILPCGEDISRVKCLSLVVKTLNCGHEVELYCCVDRNTVDCQKLIKLTLDCGHSGIYPCSTDIYNFKCEQDCEKRLTCGHKCTNKCYEKCVDCKIIVTKALPCTHTTIVECSADLNLIKCNFPCLKKNKCGHACKKKCYQVCGDCEEMVEKVLPCGHELLMKCFANVSEVICMFSCEKTLKCGHICKRKCHESCMECLEMVEKTLPCSHVALLQCGIHVDKFVCIFPCKKILKCGHKCDGKCADVCGDCMILVEKQLECGHKQLMACCTDESTVVCRQPCLKTLTCGHRCDKNCCDVICQENCSQLVRVESCCGHFVQVPCSLVNSAQYIISSYCMEPCNMVLQCEHTCTGTCGKCRQGRLHISCQRRCEKNLICGHVCSSLCDQVCHPCGFVFNYLCDHIRYSRCGSTYVRCEEKCNWICPHYKCTKKCWELCDRPRCHEPCERILNCGHGCIGLCGELCPRLCKICDVSQNSEFIEDVNFRFIQLNGCKHVFEVNFLDGWMESDTSIVGLKRCPKCDIAIGRSFRYGNIIKGQIEDIEKVKIKLPMQWSRYIRMKKEIGIESTRLTEYFPVVRSLQDRLVDKNPLSKSELILMANRIKIFTFMKIIKQTSEGFVNLSAKKFIEYEMHFFSNRLMKINDKIHEREWKNLVRELRRSELIGIYKNTESVLDDVIDFDSFNEMIKVKKMLDDDNADQQVITGSLKLVHLINALKMDFSDVDKFSAITTKELSYGHWYKCDNNHIYYSDGNNLNDHKKCCECLVLTV